MKKFIILIPLYNDWKSVSKLLKEIDLQITDWESKVSVLIVDDASTEVRPNINSNFNKIKPALRRVLFYPFCYLSPPRAFLGL